MNEAEARRRQLLEETRNLYRDDNIPPAVHPRYRAAHTSLYPDKEELPKSSLKIRIILSILCFVCYIAVDYGNIEIVHFDSDLIREQISSEMQLYEISEVLKQL